MYEYSELLAPKVHNTCCACLKNGPDVRILTGGGLNWYNQYISKFQAPAVTTRLHICYICSHLLKKTRKFIEQCLKVNFFLNQHEEKNKLDSYTISITPIYNLTITEIEIEEFIDIENNLEETITIDNDIYINEEDIPLTLLKNEEITPSEEIRSTKRKKKKRRQKSEEINVNTGILMKLEAQELDNKTGMKLTNFLEDLDKNYCTNDNIKIERDTKVRKGKEKKPLREGFTSKMVQETDEYVVIKLSKEQVLKEMEEKSISEEYMRCLYKCGKCVKGYNFEDVLTTHMEKHVLKRGWLECDICHQFCPNAVSFRGHMKSHTTRYKCKVCGCVRLARQVLLEHHSTCHTSDAVKYTCQQCDFVSIKRTSMQRHIRTRHNKIEKHPCEQCGKILNSLEALRAHTTRHDKSKRMKCDECNRWFVYPALLKQHKMSVHVRGDYYCVECDVKFKSRGNLKLHFKRHKRHRDVSSFKYQCDHCNKRFIFPSTLTGHLATAHSTATKLSCKCGRRYGSRDALRAHQRKAHEGDGQQIITSTLHSDTHTQDVQKHKQEDITIQVSQSDI